MHQILIVDYGSGNIGSIKNMLNKIGAPSIFATDPAEADSTFVGGIILPGVGSFDHAVTRLQASGWIAKIKEIAASDRYPILGICLGMQLLLNSSEEGNLPGLGIIPGTVTRFPDIEGFKVPHMGWNFVNKSRKNILSDDFAGSEKYYFVHSYFAKTDSADHTFLECKYGDINFAAGISNNRVHGVQFHPEKSHRYGYKLLKAFAESI